jgi:hypothetical protein
LTNILLTGAGFSRNWGGWLANEAFEYLLGRPEINPRIRNLLWNSGGNFEVAFQAIRDRAKPGNDASALDDLQRMNAMLAAMFEAMKIGFRSTPLETHQTSSAIRTSLFLAHFDAIFTLNQDTLLEQHYIYQPSNETTHGRWPGVEIPGLIPPAPEIQHGNQLEKAGLRSPRKEGFALDDRYQPYIKLHGSSNWQTENGYLLIMGGNKSADINQVPVLRWYHEMFRQRITQPDTRITVIGYSFGDEHINEHLFAAARADTQLFIVDPLGAEILDKRDKRAQITQPAEPLFNNLRDSVVGASRRPLRATLHNDQVEWRKFSNFLGLKLRWEE